MPTPEQRLAELGITLIGPPKPRWAYSPAVRAGNLLFISGQIATEDGRILHPGKLGGGVDVASGAEAARGCAIAALAVARQALGSLDNVARVVKLTVFVASADGFGDQPAVADGASGLLRDVFGEERGLGARSAVGVAELPLGASVEAEFIFEAEISAGVAVAREAISRIVAMSRRPTPARAEASSVRYSTASARRSPHAVRCGR